MAGEYINPTTIWTPQKGYDPGWASGGMGGFGTNTGAGNPTTSPFLMSNPNYNPDDPYSQQSIQDPTATGKAVGTQFTGANGLQTTGVMNPFGLTQNNPGMGFMGGAPPVQTPGQAPANGGQTNPFANTQFSSAQDNRPPDQRGFEGFFNPTNNMTGYATPNGQFMMDQYGNWFDQAGNPTNFDQSGQAPTGNVFNNNNVFSGAQGMPAAGTFMVNGQMIDANGQPVGPGPTPGRFGWGGDGGNVTYNNQGQPPAGPNGLPNQPGNNPYNWLQNVTSSSLDTNGKMQYSPTNPWQFASPETAAALTKQYGGSAYGLNLEGPGMGFSSPQQQIRLPNGQSLNAGLVAQTLGRKEYGSGAPGSIGQYMSGITGDNHNPGESFASWAARQPGYRPNPNLMNTQDFQQVGMDAAKQQSAGGGTGFQAPTTTGGGSLNPTTPNIFLPPPAAGGGNGSMTLGTGNTLWQGGGTNGAPGGDPIAQLLQFLNSGGGQSSPLAPPPGFSGTPDQWLADQTNNTGYLSNIAQNAGFPTDASSAWAAMVAAQQRNIARGGADLQAKFAASGGRFGSDFGNAATDYYTQAMLGQNAQLGQMTLASQEAARQRELQAAGQLSQQGFQGGAQLSSQGFQSAMQQGGFNFQSQQQADAAMQQLYGQKQLASLGYGFQGGQNDLNRQLQASLAFMGAGAGAAGQLSQQGAQGALALQNASLTGAQGLFNSSNSAAQQEIQRQLLLQQMGLGSAQTASQLWQSNLGLGNTIGQGQFNTQTAANQAQFQEWLRTQPQYSPLLQMMFSGATGYPQAVQPQYAPSWWQSLLGAAGGIAGGLGNIFSDRKLKENITLQGTENGHNLYRFNYKRAPEVFFLGVMADEVQQTHPAAVVEINGRLSVDYNAIGVNFRRTI